MIKYALLCRGNCRITQNTIYYLGKCGTKIDLVICETSLRSKFSKNEINFITSHSALNSFLIKSDRKFLLKKVLQKIKRKLFPTHTLKTICNTAKIKYIEVEKHSSEETLSIIHKNRINFCFLTSGTWLIKEILFRQNDFKIINIHNAFLPNHRGLDAMMYSLLNRNKICLSAHYIDSGIDTGNIIGYYDLNPKKNENILELRQRLDLCKPEFVMALIKNINNNSLIEITQTEEMGITHAAMTLEELITVNNFYKDIWKP